MLTAVRIGPPAETPSAYAVTSVPAVLIDTAMSRAMRVRMPTTTSSALPTTNAPKNSVHNDTPACGWLHPDRIMVLMSTFLGLFRWDVLPLSVRAARTKDQRRCDTQPLTQAARSSTALGRR